MSGIDTEIFSKCVQKINIPFLPIFFQKLASHKGWKYTVLLTISCHWPLSIPPETIGKPLLF